MCTLCDAECESVVQLKIDIHYSEFSGSLELLYHRAPVAVLDI